MTGRFAADGPTALYRYFDDKDRLLYIGITGHLSGRERGHVKSSLWMQFVARSTVKRHPGRIAALEAEREAIRTERPLFNRQYNDTPAARERVKAYLKEIGRIDLYDPQRYSGTVPPGELEMMQVRKRKRPAAESPRRIPPDSHTQTIPSVQAQFALIATPALQDDRLSLAACGLLALSMAFPDDAELTTERLADQRPDSHKTILAALAELEVNGYFRDGVIYDRKPTQPGESQAGSA
jgi:AcrR family transcriptional regulator